MRSEVAAASSSQRTRSMSFVVRVRSPSRKSRASAPLRTQTISRSDGKAHEEAVEDDGLSQADERSAPVARSYEQALLKGLTKCGSVSVLHWRLRSWMA